MKAAAARRARGRQAESTKKGGGGWRVVERHRLSVSINCIVRLYVFFPPLYSLFKIVLMFWFDLTFYFIYIYIYLKKQKTDNMWCCVQFQFKCCHFSTTTVSLFVSSLPALWLAQSIPHPSSFSILSLSLSFSLCTHRHAQVVISCFFSFFLLLYFPPSSMYTLFSHLLLSTHGSSMESVTSIHPILVQSRRKKTSLFRRFFNELIR